MVVKSVYYTLCGVRNAIQESKPRQHSPNSSRRSAPVSHLSSLREFDVAPVARRLIVWRKEADVDSSCMSTPRNIWGRYSGNVDEYFVWSHSYSDLVYVWLGFSLRPKLLECVRGGHDGSREGVRQSSDLSSIGSGYATFV